MTSIGRSPVVMMSFLGVVKGGQHFISKGYVKGLLPYSHNINSAFCVIHPVPRCDRLLIVMGNIGTVVSVINIKWTQLNKRT